MKRGKTKSCKQEVGNNSSRWVNYKKTKQKKNHTQQQTSRYIAAKDQSSSLCLVIILLLMTLTLSLQLHCV